MNFINYNQVKLSKKLFTGIFIGIATGAAISFLLKHKKSIDTFEHEENYFENDMLESANEYLLLARSKAEKMIKEAEGRSQSIIDEAGTLLSLVKEKAAGIKDVLSDEAKEDAEKLKKELEIQINRFKNKI